jgi:hypothetical protein
MRNMSNDQKSENNYKVTGSHQLERSPDSLAVSYSRHCQGWVGRDQFMRSTPPRPISVYGNRESDLSASATWTVDLSKYKVTESSIEFTSFKGKEHEYEFKWLGPEDFKRLNQWVDTLPDGRAKTRLLSAIQKADENFHREVAAVVKNATEYSKAFSERPLSTRAMVACVLQGKLNSFEKLIEVGMGPQEAKVYRLLLGLTAQHEENKRGGKDGFMYVDSYLHSQDTGANEFAASLVIFGRQHEQMRKVLSDSDYHFHKDPANDWVRSIMEDRNVSLLDKPQSERPSGSSEDATFTPERLSFEGVKLDGNRFVVGKDESQYFSVDESTAWNIIDWCNHQMNELIQELDSVTDPFVFAIDSVRKAGAIVEIHDSAKAAISWARR